MTDASLPSPSSTGRRRAGARIPAVAHSGDGAGGLVLYQDSDLITRHGRACPGHPRRPAAASQDEKPRILDLFVKSGSSFAAWMAGTSPAMTAVSICGNWYYAAIGREAAIARERLLAKLNAMAETIQRRRERHGEAPPDASDPPIAEAALDAPQAVDS